MVIDYRRDSRHAQRYDVLDAVTGENLKHLAIFYADDEAGVIRWYLRDERGGYYIHPSGKKDVAWTEERRPIRLVERPIAEGDRS